MKKLLIFLSIAIFSGCAVRTHGRYDATTGKLIQKQWVGTCLLVGKASDLDSETKDGNFSYRLRIGSIEGKGDSEMIRSIYEAGIATGKKVAIP